MDWKVINASVRGTSHIEREQPCQDASFVAIEGSTLVAACADGAGSARFAEVASKVLCQSVVVSAMQDLRISVDVDTDDVRRWIRFARARLSLEASVASAPLREFATTLLFAVLTDRKSLFAQIGDGALVLGCQESQYRVAFWPQNGEYANQTNFITDSRWESLLQVAEDTAEDSRIAMFTDGLQRLALHEATRSVHVPFFSPLFASLSKASEASALIEPMKDWLASEPVNRRTDDDKTLLLAMR